MLPSTILFSVNAVCILSVQVRERVSRVSLCVFSEIHPVKVTFGLFFLHQNVFDVFLSTEQITEQKQPKQMCLYDQY